MLEQAQKQKADADKAELQAKHSYNMLKASLESSIATQKKERDECKKELQGHIQTKATAEGDVSIARDELAKDSKSLNDAHDDCEERSHEWDVSMQSRSHEIEALDMAAKVLNEKTGGAQEQAYGFVQLAVQHSRIPDDTLDEVVHSLVSLGRDQKDKQLSMLAMKVRQFSTQSNDPFKKVKDLIEDMIGKLETEAAEEAKEKEFCDKETKKTTETKEELESNVEGLTFKLDEATARMQKLKEQIATLSEELVSIASSQKQATEDRIAEKAEFERQSSDYESGIEGVQMALKVLRDYYGQSFSQMSMGQPETTSHSNSGDGASSIIGILEVAESDFGRLLAEVRETESSAQSEYDELTEDNKVSVATKTEDIKGKKVELAELEHQANELGGDRESEQDELDAVNEYMSELNSKCVAKPEPYEERKRRREAEMEGLQNALDILEGKSMAFLSVRSLTRRA
jgi:chromosome segregation ATPase